MAEKDDKAEKHKTPSTNLADADAAKIFEDHALYLEIDKGPSDMWKLARCDCKGLTSDWAAVEKKRAMLSDILEKSAGLIPKQHKLHQQFCTFLEKVMKKRGAAMWSIKQTETVIRRCRSMLQSLLTLKRDKKSAPKRFPKLQVLMDAIKIITAEDAREKKKKGREARTGGLRMKRAQAKRGAEARAALKMTSR